MLKTVGGAKIQRFMEFKKKLQSWWSARLLAKVIGLNPTTGAVYHEKDPSVFFKVGATKLSDVTSCHKLL